MTHAVLQPQAIDTNPPVEDSGHRCIRCGYNLTGLTSQICPECGWQIDWELAGQDEEARREGTPAHRARGWRKIDGTALTVLVMLLAPWRFARQLRTDESIRPALVVAVISFLCFVLPEAPGWKEMLHGGLGYAAGISTVILCQSLVFATLYCNPLPRSPRWPERFRIWLMVSFYSTCFVALWRITGAPPMVGGLTDTNFYWPFSSGGGWPSGSQFGVTIIYYWWWTILGVVLFIRNRPRWLVFPAIPLVFLFSWIGAHTTMAVFDLLD